MLTREHAIARLDDGRLVPDRLTLGGHPHYLRLAERMIDVYRAGSGRTRQELHREIESLFRDEPDCPPRRIAAFCKLLDDSSQFATDRERRAAALRRKVFRMAAAHHPLVSVPDRLFEHAEKDVKQRIAEELGRSWDEIEVSLFAVSSSITVSPASTGSPVPASFSRATTWNRCRPRSTARAR